MSLAPPVERPSVPRRVIVLSAGAIALLVLSLLTCLAGLKHYQKLAEQKKHRSGLTPPAFMGTNAQNANGLNSERPTDQAP
jgi:hypothetical protein